MFWLIELEFKGQIIVIICQLVRRTLFLTYKNDKF